VAARIASREASAVRGERRVEGLDVLVVAERAGNGLTGRDEERVDGPAEAFIPIETINAAISAHAILPRIVLPSGLYRLHARSVVLKLPLATRATGHWRDGILEIDAGTESLLRDHHSDVYGDWRAHHLPHFHAYYQDEAAVFSLDPIELIAGSLSRRERRLVEAWAELHQEELIADWQRLQSGQAPLPIEPLD
jgi:hypothetical protein